MAPPGTPECPAWGNGIDFDGVNGTSDIGIGIPTGTASGLVKAGSIEIRYGCGTTLGPQNIALPTPHAGDLFGAASVAVDINNDRYDDLVVGIPDYDVGSASDAGAIAIFLGSATGLHYARTLTQNSAGVPGVVQAGAHFGTALSTVPVLGDETVHTVRIGEPGKNVGSATGAGGYVDLSWNGSGALQTTGTDEVTLNSAGIAGTAAAGDALGSSLWQFSAVGAPGKSVDGHAGAGAALEEYNGATALVTQDTACMPGTAEAGDHFGATVAGAWIGVPDEDVGSVADAGMVERWDPNGIAKQCFGLTQNLPGVNGTAEKGDHFGSTLVELGSYEDDADYFPTALIIGVPDEDTAHGANSGTVDVERENYDVDTNALTIAGAGSADGPYPGPRAGFGTAITEYDGGVLISAPDAFGEGLVFAYTFDGAKLDFTASFEQLTGTKVKYTFGTSLSQTHGAR